MSLRSEKSGMSKPTAAAGLGKPYKQSREKGNHERHLHHLKSKPGLLITRYSVRGTPYTGSNRKDQ